MNEVFVLCARTVEKNTFFAESALFLQLSQDHLFLQQQNNRRIGIAIFNHSWHIGNATFANDLCEMLSGDLDWNKIPTRTSNE